MTLFLRSAASGLLLAGLAGVAQQPPTMAPPATTDSVIKTSSTLVLVDVVVTEKGKAVHGVEPHRFHVLEDGHDQALTSVEEHLAAPARPEPAAHHAEAEPNIVSNFPEAPPGSAVNVLLLDGLNTSLVNQMEVRREMVHYLEQIAPGTQMAIFTLGSGLRMVQGFTANVGELTEALKNHRDSPQPSSLVDPAAQTTMDSAVNDLAQGGAGSDALTALQQFESETTSMQTDIRVKMTLSAFQQLARYLSAVPGRKNLIWLSGSFPLTIDPEPSLQDPTEVWRTYYEDLRETSLMLAAARVSVYPVDARGVMNLPSADASQSQMSRALTSSGATPRRRGKRASPGGMSSVPAPGADDAKFLKQTAEEHESMQEIAEATGGRAYVNTNGLREAVADALEDGASYYTLAYVPARRDFHGDFRRIKVRIDEGDYKLAYHAGYYADAPEKANTHRLGETSRIVATTMHGAPTATEILFKARVLPASDPVFRTATFSPGPVGEMSGSLKPGSARYVVDFAVDPRSIQFSAGEDGRHTAELELVLLGYDSDGKRVNYLDRGFSLTLDRDRFAQVTAKGIPLRMELSLPSGHNFLRIAIQDLSTGRCGSVEMRLLVK